MKVERHPGPWIGPDTELARACAMVAIRDYGTDGAVTHQRIMTDGVWNDHVAVQAALAAIHYLRSSLPTLIIERAEQACRYVAKNNESAMGQEERDSEHGKGFLTACEVCEQAIGEHVKRHIDDDIARAVAAASTPAGEG